MKGPTLSDTDYTLKIISVCTLTMFECFYLRTTMVVNRLRNHICSNQLQTTQPKEGE
jgi:hypothetical protein